MLVVGSLGGYLASARVGKAQCDASIQAVDLAEAATSTAQYTAILKAFREGKQDLALNNTEIMLDHSLIHLAEEYSLERDWYGGAARALTFARDYRANYPHKPSTDWAAKRVEAALAIKTAGVCN